MNQLISAKATDDEILALGRKEGRVIVTQDLDFSTLPALGEYDRLSLVTLRTTDADPDFVTRRLLDTLPLFKTQLMHGCVVTIGDERYRVRSMPINE